MNEYFPKDPEIAKDLVEKNPFVANNRGLGPFMEQGHPERPLGKYEIIAKRIGTLVDTKQDAYGDSFGKAPNILRILYPTGIRPDQYEDVLAIVRILDKFSRIATDKDALGENPWQDIAGYALLMNGARD